MIWVICLNLLSFTLNIGAASLNVYAGKYHLLPINIGFALLSLFIIISILNE